MGRRFKIKSIDCAYIAGFLDGDGCIVVQIKNRSDSPRGWRLMVCLNFYQDSRHKKHLVELRNIIGIGYLSDRNDKITELKINGYNTVCQLIKLLIPYLRFKKVQASKMLEIGKIIGKKNLPDLSAKNRAKIAQLIIGIRNSNYFSSQRKFSDSEIKNILSLSP